MKFPLRLKPADIPPSIDIDVTNLQVADTITVADIKELGNFTINHEEDEVSCIHPPSSSRRVN